MEKDIVFTTANNVALKLDLARPASTAGVGPFPFVVCFHGGGWQIDDKKSLRKWITELAKHGYAAASANFRLVPDHWPAQIEDAKCAIRYMRSRAKELNIDPNRCAAMGEDSGGHLSLMLGVLRPEDGLEGTGGYANQSSQVQAVVNFYGPVDLRSWTVEGTFVRMQIRIGLGKTPERVVGDFLGAKDTSDPVCIQASPITYARASLPPMLTVCGEKDIYMPVAESRKLHEAFTKAGAPHELIVVEGGGHSFSGLMDKTRPQVFAFLEKQLAAPTK